MDPASRHGDLLAEMLEATPDPPFERDPHGERRRIVAGLVVARWIWSDPLADPGAELNPIIAQGFLDLIRHSPGAGRRLISEATSYHRGRRP